MCPQSPSYLTVNIFKEDARFSERHFGVAFEYVYFYSVRSLNAIWHISPNELQATTGEKRRA